MRLEQVIAGTGAEGAIEDDAEIALVTCDSRAVRPGALFFAVRGVLPVPPHHPHALSAASTSSSIFLASPNSIRLLSL